MGAEPVLIADVCLERTGDYQKLAATVDGEHIWYRLPNDLDLVPRAEAFLAPALFEAMVRGVPVQVDDSAPVSEKLLHSLSDIQSIFNCWNKDLKIVPIYASITRDCAGTSIVASCFSGGVDSSYTYLCNKDSITHFLLVQGFAGGRGGANDWQRNIAARQKYAESEKKTLIAVHTNITEYLTSRKLSILLAYGGILCGLGAGLGVKKLFVPASHTFRDLIPSGSHPMLDPLWSTEVTTIIHHGVDMTRTDKTAFITKNQSLLNQLQVCWYAGGGNCGECGKCIRTALALHLLGAKSESLPRYSGLKQLKPLKYIDSHVQVPYLNELIELADRVGEKLIARRLRRYAQSYQFRRLTSDLVGELIGRRGRDAIRKLRPKAWHSARGTLVSVRTSERN